MPKEKEDIIKQSIQRSVEQYFQFDGGDFSPFDTPDGSLLTLDEKCQLIELALSQQDEREEIKQRLSVYAKRDKSNYQYIEDSLITIQNIILGLDIVRDNNSSQHVMLYLFRQFFYTADENNGKLLLNNPRTRACVHEIQEAVIACVSAWKVCVSNLDRAVTFISSSLEDSVNYLLKQRFILVGEVIPLLDHYIQSNGKNAEIALQTDLKAMIEFIHEYPTPARAYLHSCSPRKNILGMIGFLTELKNYADNKQALQEKLTQDWKLIGEYDCLKDYRQHEEQIIAQIHENNKSNTVQVLQLNEIENFIDDSIGPKYCDGVQSSPAVIKTISLSQPHFSSWIVEHDGEKLSLEDFVLKYIHSFSNNLNTQATQYTLNNHVSVLKNHNMTGEADCKYVKNFSTYAHEENSDDLFLVRLGFRVNPEKQCLEIIRDSALKKFGCLDQCDRNGLEFTDSIFLSNTIFHVSTVGGDTQIEQLSKINQDHVFHKIVSNLHTEFLKNNSPYVLVTCVLKSGIIKYNADEFNLEPLLEIGQIDIQQKNRFLFTDTRRDESSSYAITVGKHASRVNHAHTRALKHDCYDLMHFDVDVINNLILNLGLSHLSIEEAAKRVGYVLDKALKHNEKFLSKLKIDEAHKKNKEFEVFLEKFCEMVIDKKTMNNEEIKTNLHTFKDEIDELHANDFYLLFYYSPDEIKIIFPAIFVERMQLMTTDQVTQMVEAFMPEQRADLEQKIILSRKISSLQKFVADLPKKKEIDTKQRFDLLIEALTPANLQEFQERINTFNANELCNLIGKLKPKLQEKILEYEFFLNKIKDSNHFFQYAQNLHSSVHKKILQSFEKNIDCLKDEEFCALIRNFDPSLSKDVLNIFHEKIENLTTQDFICLVTRFPFDTQEKVFDQFATKIDGFDDAAVHDLLKFILKTDAVEDTQILDRFQDKIKVTRSDRFCELIIKFHVSLHSRIVNDFQDQINRLNKDDFYKLIRSSSSLALQIRDSTMFAEKVEAYEEKIKKEAEASDMRWSQYGFLHNRNNTHKKSEEEQEEKSVLCSQILARPSNNSM